VFSSWWFWSWGAITQEDWCAPNLSYAPADAVPVKRTVVDYSEIPFGCIAGGCEGQVHEVEGSCPSGFVQDSIEDICGKTTGMATADRQCDPGKGFYQRRQCSQTISSEVMFYLETRLANEGKCDVKLPKESGKLRTCMWAANKWNDHPWASLYTMNAAGDCVELFGDNVILNADDAGTADNGSIKTQGALGAGAAFGVAPIAGAAVIGMAIMRRKNAGKRQAASKEMLRGGGDNTL